MCHGGDVAREACLKLIDVVAVVCHAGFLRAHPQQVGVVNIHAEYAGRLFLVVCHGVGALWLHLFHLVGVDIHLQQSRAVGGNPDVAFPVARHAVDAAVDAVAGESYGVADGGVPFVGFLVIHHQRALSVEPDVIYLVGKGLERLALSESFGGNLVGGPYG